MALNKLYYVYGLDTACLYTDEENKIEKKIVKARYVKKLISEKIDKSKGEEKNRQRERLKKRLELAETAIGKYKPMLKSMLAENKDLVRTVRQDKIYNKYGERSLRRRVSIFDSDLTRHFGLKEREFNTEIVIVKVFFFDVAKSIVKNGFYMEGKKYVFFSSSAGQIRTKKMVAVREDLLQENWNSLTAGLTVESINAQGGMNINKYLAYLALCNSATDLWEDFDIDRCIVVDDFETNIHGDVDYIDRDTYEITRTEMDVPVTHTDGCGMILPSVSKKNFMVRLPWVKGLLGVFDFIKFIKENNGNPVITDIYGDNHNLIKEDIQVIFTKSQFKMWKYYSSWQEYKNNFKKYGSHAGKCKVEEDVFPNANINYQMIQTLTDMTDEEIETVSKRSCDFIDGITTDKNKMLRAFGADDWNNDKNGFQKCLSIYPELLNDSYCRQTLKEIKNSRERELWAAKMEIDGKYTFILPDLYAFCERLFLNIEVPKGLLADKEVYCSLYNAKELDCLRSPHLYIEHCVRNNIKNDKIKEWFTTKALYTSTYDLISKVLMFDVDGDTSLVVADKTIVEVAKRNSTDVVPLFYEMAKAKAKEVNYDTIYEGLELAYTGGNIGEISNAISKIWNSSEITEDKKQVVKLLVMNNNFVIDYAKTLFKPIPPDSVKDRINEYTKGKLPYFFVYAKKKKEKQVIESNGSPVNRIRKLRPQKKISCAFKGTYIGKLDYRVLMHDIGIETDRKVIDLFKKLTRHLNYKMVNNGDENNYSAIFEAIKQELLNTGYSLGEICDMLVRELFYEHKTAKKLTFWNIFGDTVYEHINEKVLSGFIECKRCGKRFYPDRVTQIYCPKCQGYQKQGTKTLVCIDCGKEFESFGRMKSLRCQECQIIYRRKYKTQKDKERYHKNK